MASNVHVNIFLDDNIRIEQKGRSRFLFHPVSEGNVNVYIYFKLAYGIWLYNSLHIQFWAALTKKNN